MSAGGTDSLRSIPSLKALLFFNTIARHLNLVRAAKELHLTQGALSRQLKGLEEHLGVELFKRGPRGLAFTQEGEILYDYSKRAFDTLSTGLRHLSVVEERATLVLSVARTFAIRVLSSRIGSFVRANPWVDVRIDIHRYFADLETSGADISIRLGNGEWKSDRIEPLTDDAVWAVANPAVAARLAPLQGTVQTGGALLLRNTERDYWDSWLAAGNPAAALEEMDTLRFNDSATMLEAASAGAGFCLTRACLVGDAVAAGSLVRLWDNEMRDGLRYYALCAPRSGAKNPVNLFMRWLLDEFSAAARAPARIPP